MIEYTRDEMLVICISREIPPQAIVAQGISTPLVSAAYHLAKLTHAPNITISYTVGNTFSKNIFPIRLTNYETFTIGQAIQKWSFIQAASEYLHTIKPWIEFFRPAQVDAYGNTNNVVIGDYYNPKVRLPGCAGIGDVTNYLDDIVYYLPKHDKKNLVEKVDFISGTGWISEQAGDEMLVNRKGPKKIITELCIFEFIEGRAELRSIHPYTSIEEIKENTGFEFSISDQFHVTPPPSTAEIHLLQNEIDPLGIRKIEMLSGKERISYLKNIIDQEQALFGYEAKDKGES